MKFIFSLLSTCLVATAFAQCPGNGPCPYRQGTQNRGNYPQRYSNPSNQNFDQAYHNQPSVSYYQQNRQIAMSQEEPRPLNYYGDRDMREEGNPLTRNRFEQLNTRERE